MTSTHVKAQSLEPTVAKAGVLLDALPLIRRFRGSTLVIKYGGSAMIDDKLEIMIAQDIVMLESVGINPVVVHGGGQEISAHMRRVGLEPEFHKGQRVTTAETMEITEMVLAGKLNGEIVSRINQFGGRAVGLSGKDGPLLLARKLVGEAGRDMGFVGEVETVLPDLLDLLISREYIPVISPIGVDRHGQSYNINADNVAAEIAVALGARKLVLLTDVRGIMRDRADEASLVPTVTVDEAEGLIAEGVIQGGMIPKVRACLRALEGGARKAHILDGRLPHAVLLELFTEEGIGTEIVRKGEEQAE